MTYPPGGSGQWRPADGSPPYEPPTCGQPTYGQPTYGQSPFGEAPIGPPPGFGAPPGLPGPPRKPGGRGRTVAIVLAAVAGVLVVGLVGIVVVNALRAPQTQASPGTYSPVPPTYSALLSIPTSSTPVTTPPTTSTTPPRTTPPPTATPRTTQPPAPPQPQPVYTLGDNPLFGDLGLSKVQCSWPAYQPDLAAQKAHFTAVFACLGKAWAPVMAARNLPFTPPTVYVFDQPRRYADAITILLSRPRSGSSATARSSSRPATFPTSSTSCRSPSTCSSKWPRTNTGTTSRNSAA